MDLTVFPDQISVTCSAVCCKHSRLLKADCTSIYNETPTEVQKEKTLGEH